MTDATARLTEAIASLPVPLVALVLWSTALLRGAGYYLLGRLSRGQFGGRLDDWVHRASRGRIEQAEVRMRAVGPKAIILAYPFYGVSAGTPWVLGGGLVLLVAWLGVRRHIVRAQPDDRPAVT